LGIYNGKTNHDFRPTLYFFTAVTALYFPHAVQGWIEPPVETCAVCTDWRTTHRCGTCQRWLCDAPHDCCADTEPPAKVARADRPETS
jgi:hypothetical protein